MSSAPINGSVDPAFAPVAEAFRANFEPGDTDPGDLGSALCVMAGSRVVVDLWGGWQDLDRTRAWAADTLVDTYSVLKPIVGVLALRMVESGELTLDAPIADVWPAFAAEGKESVTLRQVLAHRAGLPAARAVLPDDALYDWDTMCAALADSAPWWEPGTAHGYHVNAYGFLAGEPVCCAAGTSFSAALWERLAGPLDLDLHVGLHDAEIARVADIDTVSVPPSAAGIAPTDDEHSRMLLHTYFNPPGLSGVGVMNTDRWRRAAVPSTNGHATARAIAGFYASMLDGAPQPALGAQLRREATTTHSDGDDIVLGRPTRFGLGFALHLPERPIGTSPAAFGHFGYGGSLGFADPDAEVAFGYLINRPGDRWQNPRSLRLLEALRCCL